MIYILKRSPHNEDFLIDGGYTTVPSFLCVIAEQDVERMIGVKPLRSELKKDLSEVTVWYDIGSGEMASTFYVVKIRGMHEQS